MPVRRSAKVILIDTEGKVLLFRGGDPQDPDAGTWWFPPGGGQDDGESVHDCARREVREETGLVLDDLGPIVHRRTETFRFMGESLESDETYFAVTVEPFAIDTSEWTDLERQVVEEHRWWQLADLRTAPDTIYPEGLVALVEQHLEARP